MDIEFLTKLLPKTGLYCTGRLLPHGGFAHQFFPSVRETAESLKAMDAAGHTMYLAQSTFSLESYQNWQHNKTVPKGGERLSERAGALVQSVRSFWIDIDCGEEKFIKEPHKAYPTQLDAAKDLRRFCHDSGFPFPSLVSSGHGLYAHWALEEDISAGQWRALAGIFKQVLAHHKFRQDPSRTSDLASVLRPVGTHNRKTSEVKDVKVLQDAAPLPVAQFMSLLDHAAAKAKIVAPALVRPTEFRGINDEYTAGIEGPPASAYKIAEKCAQLKEMRDKRGDISEPAWYAALGVLRYCVEGDDLIHEWSAGHAGYSPLATAEKIQHHIDSGAGPTTCSKFAQDNHTLCLGCAAANKVKSPILLGRPELEMVAAITEEEVDYLPKGFRRAKDGVFLDDPDAAPVRIYPYDLYPCKIALDQTQGFEVVTIRHQLPVSGDYREFAIRSAYLHDKKALLTALCDNHVQISGKDAQNAIMSYLDAYMARLRSLKSLATLHSQMGWKQDGAEQTFVLGARTIKIEGEDVTGFARNIPEVALSFAETGDLSSWRAATKILALPGAEPLAFAFLAAAFGAPLMRFTGYAGAMVAMVGRTGVGKTFTGRLALSVYGDPSKLFLAKNDTTNALISRLGLYGSLPLYLDEVSNIEGQDLSDLLYRVTEGRDKVRLGRDARERTTINSWNTVALCSSNHSLVDKLSSLKADASAEINRVMEIVCRRIEGFTREAATPAYRAAQDNYGTAGPVYLRYLVENQLDHKEKLDAMTATIDKLSGAGNDERFWSAMSAVAIYGGLVARKLGLIEFEVVPVMNWLIERIKEMRGDRIEAVVAQIDVLGQFLDEMAGSILVTAGDESKLCSILREPRGHIAGRIMSDKQLLYISRSVLKHYLDKHYGSYMDLRDEMLRVGALKDPNARRVLGAGTYIGGTQQPVWVIDLQNPSLGRRILAAVTSLQDVRKEGRG